MSEKLNREGREGKSFLRVIKDWKWTRVLNAVAAAFTILPMANWGQIVKADEIFKEQAAACQTLEGKINPKHPSEETKVGIEDLSGFIAKSIEPPSLQVTRKLTLGQNLENKNKILETLRSLRGSNIYVDPPVRSKGEVYVSPDTNTLNTLFREISNLIVEGWDAKIVNNKESSEFTIEEVGLYVYVRDQPTQLVKLRIARTDLLKLNAVNIKPRLIIEIVVTDNREKLKPRRYVFSGYAEIKINPNDPMRENRGEFNYEELNKAVKEAMNNLFILFQNLELEESFLSIAESMRKPTFPVIGFVQSNDPQNPWFLYAISVKDKNSLGENDEIYVFVRISSSKILLEGPLDLRPFFLDKKRGILFVLSDDFNNIGDVAKYLEEKLKVKVDPNSLPGLCYVVKAE